MWCVACVRTDSPKAEKSLLFAETGIFVFPGRDESRECLPASPSRAAALAMARSARRLSLRCDVTLNAMLLVVLLAGGVVTAKETAAKGTCDDGYGALVRCASLTPRVPLFSELAVIGGPPKLYRLSGLHPNTAYEVRVSYPATNPAEISITLIDPEDLTKKRNKNTNTGRKLLNVEKLVLPSKTLSGMNGMSGSTFSTSHAKQLTVRVDAKKYGIHRTGKGFGNVVYDLVLEPCLDPWGLVPKQAVPVAAAALASVVVAILVAPRIQKAIWPNHVAETRRKVW